MKRQIIVTAMGLVAARFAHADVRNTGTFHAVELKGVVAVEIKLDATTRVEVIGDADAVAHITTDVKNGSLIVDTKGDLHTKNKLVVTISTPTLDAIALSGTGSVHVAGVTAPAFAVSLSGTGTIDATGATDSLAVDLGGSGSLHAKDLPAKAVTIAVGGTGSAAITASEALTANLSGVGSVDVYGHPKSVTKNVSGVGRINLR
jgi:hypothetical protein